jgi:hypothetical protein
MKACPSCGSRYAYCPECNRQFEHGKATYCGLCEVPIDCACGLAVCLDGSGVLTLDSDLMRYGESL